MSWSGHFHMTSSKFYPSTRQPCYTFVTSSCLPILKFWLKTRNDDALLTKLQTLWIILHFHRDFAQPMEVQLLLQHNNLSSKECLNATDFTLFSEMFWSLLQLAKWMTPCKHFVEGVSDQPICYCMSWKETTEVINVWSTIHKETTLHHSITDEMAQKLGIAEMPINSKCF